MNPTLVNFILFAYIVSPVIVVILFGILIIYGGRFAEAIGVLVFIIIIFGHTTALVITAKNRKRFEWKCMCIDVVLFISQLIFTVSGVVIGIINASNKSFTCYAKNKNVHYHDVSFTITTTPEYNKEHTVESTKMCDLPIGLFIGSLAILIIRCWVLPIIEKYRGARRKKR